MPNKAFIVGSGFERGITGWKAHKNSLDQGRFVFYGAFPF